MSENEGLALVRQRMMAINILADIARNPETSTADYRTASTAYSNFLVGFNAADICSCGLPPMQYQLKSDCREHGKGTGIKTDDTREEL